MSEPFDLKTFLASLVFMGGEVKVPKIELIAEDRNAVRIFLAIPGAEDDPIGVGVLWMPQASLLRFTFNLDLSEIEVGSEEEAGTLYAIVNFLNHSVWNRISKLTAHQDDQSGEFIGNVVFTMPVTGVLLQSEDGFAILRELVSTSIFRLVAEGTTISMELHAAWRQQAAIPGEDRPG